MANESIAAPAALNYPELVTVPVGGGSVVVEVVAGAVDKAPAEPGPECPPAVPIAPADAVARVRAAEDAGHSLADAYELVAAALHVSARAVSDCYAEHAGGCYITDGPL